MTKSPAFQFYPNDWLSSARIATMTLEQEGAYIRLLCYCWASGDCTIPNDDDKLLRLSRLKNIDDLRVVQQCFNQCPTDSTKMVHDRLLLEHEKQLKWREKSAEGGKRSAAKRIEKQQDLKGGSRVVQPKGNSSSSSSSSNNKNIIKDFEEFWQLYPRRDGSKSSAKVSYSKSIKEITHEELIRCVKIYTEGCRAKNVGKEFIPHATTWLNQKRWETVEEVNSDNKKRNVVVL
jgi:uncharacterized protein YdaU (DUF1376 family)